MPSMSYCAGGSSNAPWKFVGPVGSIALPARFGARARLKFARARLSVLRLARPFAGGALRDEIFCIMAIPLATAKEERAAPRRCETRCVRSVGRPPQTHFTMLAI